MAPIPDLRPTILAAWPTNSLVTAHLVEQLPTVVWEASIPGEPRRTIHHRGQIIMVARQLGHRLPPIVVNGLWQWTVLVREWKRER